MTIVQVSPPMRPNGQKEAQRRRRACWSCSPLELGRCQRSRAALTTCTRWQEAGPERSSAPVGGTPPREPLGGAAAAHRKWRMTRRKPRGRWRRRSALAEPAGTARPPLRPPQGHCGSTRAKTPGLTLGGGQKYRHLDRTSVLRKNRTGQTDAERGNSVGLLWTNQAAARRETVKPSADSFIITRQVVLPHSHKHNTCAHTRTVGRSTPPSRGNNIQPEQNCVVAGGGTTLSPVGESPRRPFPSCTRPGGRRDKAFCISSLDGSPSRLET